MADPAVEEYERQRSVLERRLEELAVLILSGDESDIGVRAGVLARKAAVTATRAALAGIVLADFGDTEADEVYQKIYDESVEAVTDLALDEVRAVSREARTRTAGMTAPEKRQWARTVSHNVATRVASEMAVKMAPAIAEVLGVPVRKLWISRGDSKVRELHRRLHGDTRAVEAPFWRDLDGGGQLQYPGDTSAPIAAWINCRCGMFLVPAPEAMKAEQVFNLENEDFEAMAASAYFELWDTGALTDLCRAAAG